MTTIQNVRLPLSAAPGDRVDVSFNDVIEHIEPTGCAVPDGDTVDGKGGFLIPGLIDTHAHLASRDGLLDAARAGVTTLVDLGTYPDHLITQLHGEGGVSDFISAGTAASAPGSTQIVTMGFPTDGGVTGPDDAERYVDWRTANGADLIKIIVEDPAATDVPALDVPTLKALVDEAHVRGLLTVAHVVTAAAFERGLDAGCDILTHVPLDRALPAGTVQRIVDTGTIVSPTLVMMRMMARMRAGDKAEAAIENSTESVRRLLGAGVPVIAGTDANETPLFPVPHGGSLHDELGFLRDAGMTDAEALLAAASEAAAAMRLTDRGSIAPGKRADLVLLDSDPTTDIAAVRTPRRVWIGGWAVV